MVLSKLVFLQSQGGVHETPLSKYGTKAASPYTFLSCPIIFTHSSSSPANTSCSTTWWGSDLFTLARPAGSFAIRNVTESICVKGCFEPSCLVRLEPLFSCSFELVTFKVCKQASEIIFTLFSFKDWFFFFKESSWKKSTFSHPYLMPKHFQGHQHLRYRPSLRRLNPKEKKVCESYEQMEGGFYF